MTKNFEIYIIELPKFEKYSNESELSNWVKFIINPEVIKMSEVKKNESLKKAHEVLNEISDDEREEELAFQRLMYIMDKKAIEAAGFDKGEKVGIEKGIKQGVKRNTLKIAKELLGENIDISIIAKVTNLPKEEIEKLKD